MMSYGDIFTVEVIEFEKLLCVILFHSKQKQNSERSWKFERDNCQHSQSPGTQVRVF